MVDLRQVLKGGKEMAWKTPKTDWTPDDGISAEDLRRIEQNIAQLMHPIGTIYENALDPRNPREIFGFGVWERFGEGRMLVGYDYNDSDFNNAGKKGGAKTHRLTIDEMPPHEHTTSNSGAHNHQYTDMYHSNEDPVNTGVGGSRGVRAVSPISRKANTDSSGAHNHKVNPTGGGKPHNNMPPYVVVYRWIRVA